MARKTSSRPAVLQQLKPKSLRQVIALKHAGATVRLLPPADKIVQGQIDGGGAMTPRQVQLVQSSFARIEPIKDQAAALFYRRLFELDPGLRPLFRRDMTAQRAKLMAALGAVVGSLDRLENVLPLVRGLGRRHAAYGARPDHYATLGQALIWTLAQALGAAFTREARRAWTDAYGHLAWAMIAAAEEDEALGQAA